MLAYGSLFSNQTVLSVKNDLLEKLDTCVLNWIQKCADKAEEYVGVSRFTWAAIFFSISFALLQTYHLIYVRGPNSFAEIPLIYAPCAQYVGFIAAVFGIVEYWKMYVRDGMRKRAFGNPMVQSYLMPRVVVLLTTICALFYGFLKGPFVGSVLSFSCIFETIGLYLLCTTPKPMEKSKLRNFFDSFGGDDAQPNHV